MIIRVTIEYDDGEPDDADVWLDTVKRWQEVPAIKDVLDASPENRVTVETLHQRVALASSRWF